MYSNVVICDLDGTFVKTNSFTLFVKWSFRHFRRCRIRLALIVIARKMRFISHSYAKKLIVNFVKQYLGENEIMDFLGTLETYINSEVRNIVFSNSNALKVLATAAPSLYADSFAKSMGFDFYVSTSDNGPECRGEEKVWRVRKILEEFSFIPSTVTVISDHEDDLPLFRWNKDGVNLLVSGCKVSRFF